MDLQGRSGELGGAASWLALAAWMGPMLGLTALYIVGLRVRILAGLSAT